jgi:hypothetical protein
LHKFGLLGLRTTLKKIAAVIRLFCFSKIMSNLSMLGNTSVNKQEASYSIKSTSRVVISVLFTITSFAGNTLVLLAVYRFQRLRTISNMIIANLSLADVLFSAIVAPINVFYWSQEDLLPSVIPCHVSGVGAMLFGLSSIYTLVFVSIERFLATNYPLKHRNSFGEKVVKYGLAVIWMWSGVVCVLTFGISRYTYLKSFFHCIPDWGDSLSYTLAILFSGNVIPLAILIYCNTRVLKIIHKRKQIQTMSKLQGSTKSHTADHQREKRVSMIIIAVISLFIFCWTPYSIAITCLAVDGCTLPQEFMSAAVVLTISNGSFNPIIYGVMNRNFRAAFAAILGCTKQTQQRSHVRNFGADTISNIRAVR